MPYHDLPEPFAGRMGEIHDRFRHEMAAARADQAEALQHAQEWRRKAELAEADAATWRAFARREQAARLQAERREQQYLRLLRDHLADETLAALLKADDAWLGQFERAAAERERLRVEAESA